MVPTAFDEENCVFNAPPNMDNCDALSTWKGNTKEGDPVVISWWKPTKEEMEEIKKTGRIWVIVYGVGMPPIAPVGINPFKNGSV